MAAIVRSVVVVGGILVLGRRVTPSFVAGVGLIAGGLVAIGSVATLPGLMAALFALGVMSIGWIIASANPKDRRRLAYLTSTLRAIRHTIEKEKNTKK